MAPDWSADWLNREAKALLDLKQKWGFKDPRAEMKNCDICANDTFRESWREAGVAPKAFEAPRFSGATSPAPESANGNTDQESLIQAITNRVMEVLSKR